VAPERPAPVTNRKKEITMNRPELTLRLQPASRAERPVFASLRGASAVAGTVTILVSAWFLVAAGVIIAEPASPYTTRSVQVHTFPTIEVVGHTASLEPKGVRTVAQTRSQPQDRTALATEPVGIVPDARFLITVEARRG
jgi:hypothetical protein